MTQRRVWLVLPLLMGCDVAAPEWNLGPWLQVTAVSPRSGEGLDCDIESESDCGAATNLPIVLSFNRWLLPSSATRQSLTLSTASAPLWYFNSPKYDLLRRSIQYTTRGGFSSGLTYTVTVTAASADESGFGFRAYDGAVLDTNTVPHPFVFRTRGPVSLPEARAAVSCRMVRSAFAGAGCAKAGCHAGNAPAVGLALDTAKGIGWMVGRVARSADRGTSSGQVTVASDRFGVGMAIVQSASPQDSLLSYRVLLDRDAYRDATGEIVVEPPPDDELERVRTWFGVMGPMPPSRVGWAAGVSPVDLVRTILDWIEDGASNDDCE